MKKLASLLEKTWSWLVLSSANANNISLTVKGALATGVASIIGVLGAVHYQVPGLPDSLNAITDQIVIIVQYGLGIVGGVSIIVGAVRKIWLSIVGKHAAVDVAPAPANPTNAVGPTA